MGCAAGCASTAAPLARVLPAGAHEASVSGDIAFASPKISPGAAVDLPYPMMAAGYRYGIGFDTDLGAQAWGFGTLGFWGFGASVDAKYGVIRRPAGSRGFELSIAPGTGYHQINLGGAPTHVFLARLPVLIGYNTTGQDQLVLAPRVDYQRATAVDLNPVDAVLVGWTLTYAWRVASWVEVRPSATYLYSPVRFNGTLDDPDRTGYTFFSAGVGGVFYFGAD